MDQGVDERIKINKQMNADDFILCSTQGIDLIRVGLRDLPYNPLSVNR